MASITIRLAMELTGKLALLTGAKRVGAVVADALARAIRVDGGRHLE